MEFDPIAKAEELKKKLEEEVGLKGLSAIFDIHVEPNGTNEGAVYVRKEKPGGEMVFYEVGEDEKLNNS